MNHVMTQRSKNLRTERRRKSTSQTMAVMWTRTPKKSEPKQKIRHTRVGNLETLSGTALLVATCALYIANNA